MDATGLNRWSVVVAVEPIHREDDCDGAVDPPERRAGDRGGGRGLHAGLDGVQGEHGAVLGGPRERAAEHVPVEVLLADGVRRKAPQGRARASRAGDDDALAIPAVLAAAATRLFLPLSTIVMSISFGSLVRARPSTAPNLSTGTLGNPLFFGRPEKTTRAWIGVDPRAIRARTRRETGSSPARAFPATTRLTLPHASHDGRAGRDARSCEAGDRSRSKPPKISARATRWV